MVFRLFMTLSNRAYSSKKYKGDGGVWGGVGTITYISELQTRSKKYRWGGGGGLGWGGDNVSEF